MWHCRRDFAEGSEADPSNADEHLDRVTNSRNHALVNRRSVLCKGDLADAVLAASRQEAASPLSRLLGADPPPEGLARENGTYRGLSEPAPLGTGSRSRVPEGPAGGPFPDSISRE